MTLRFGLVCPRPLFLLACIAVALTVVATPGPSDANDEVSSVYTHVATVHGTGTNDNDEHARVHLTTNLLFANLGIAIGTVDAGIIKTTEPNPGNNACLPFAWNIRRHNTTPERVSFDCLTITTSPNLVLPIFKLETFSAELGENEGDPGKLIFVGDYYAEYEANTSPVSFTYERPTVLTVVTDPPGAHVRIDGRSRGITGCTNQEVGQTCEPGDLRLGVKPGTRKVWLSKDGYEVEIRDITLWPRQHKTLSVDLISLEAEPIEYAVETVVEGLHIPWDVGFTPDNKMIFTERNGRLSIHDPATAETTLLATAPEAVSSRESGMLGLAVSPSFASNRLVHTCQTHSVADVVTELRVVEWTVNADYTAAARRDVITGIPTTEVGQHVGCQLEYDNTGALLVSVGDLFMGSAPQDLTNMGGKVLRVDPMTGDGLADNPFATSSDATTRRIYTYGHRNPQGLGIHPSTGQVYSVEHGPAIDDEVNALVPGGNYGWNPIPGYNEDVPMTDIATFPDAHEAIWSSGFPTTAASGGTFINHSSWGEWNQSFAFSNLKTSHVRLLQLDTQGAVSAQTSIVADRGRLRAAVMGPDGSLYVTTSNGSDADAILKVTPVPGVPSD